MNSDMQNGPNNERPSDDMLEAYAQGRLSEQDEIQVQAWLMDNPDTLTELEVDAAIQIGIKGHQQQSFTEHQPEATSGGLLDKLASFFKPRFIPLHATAYAVAIASSVLLIQKSTTVEPTIVNFSGNIITPVTLRSEGEELIPHSNSSIPIFAYRVENNITEKYTVQILRNGELESVKSGYETDSTGFIYDVRIEYLNKSGEFEARISGESSDFQVTYYWKLATPQS